MTENDLPSKTLILPIILFIFGFVIILMILLHFTMDKQSNTVMADINSSLISLQQREQDEYIKIVKYDQQNGLSTQTGDVMKQLNAQYPRLQERIAFLQQLQARLIQARAMRALRNKRRFLYSGTLSTVSGQGTNTLSQNK